MKTYEYARLSISGDASGYGLAELNVLGAKGWLLIGPLVEFGPHFSWDGKRASSYHGLFVREVSLDTIFADSPDNAVVDKVTT